jgi:hypothetical protein
MDHLTRALSRTARRLTVLTTTSAVVLVAVGCGSSDTQHSRIAISVSSPADGSRVSADRVTVRGTVTPPDATVQVGGQDAQVGNGIFTASIPLHSGTNTIDVLASAPGSAPASTAINVTRPRAHRKAATTGTPTSSAPAATTPTQTGADDWPGGSGYTAILASETSESEARATQAKATAAGLDAGVLYSNNYRSLRTGFWVVFSGAFQTQEQASRRAARAQELGYDDAYPRFISP